MNKPYFSLKSTEQICDHFRYAKERYDEAIREAKLYYCRMNAVLCVSINGYQNVFSFHFTAAAI